MDNSRNTSLFSRAWQGLLGLLMMQPPIAYGVLGTWAILAVLLHFDVIGRGFTTPAVIFTIVCFVVWLADVSTRDWRTRWLQERYNSINAAFALVSGRYRVVTALAGLLMMVPPIAWAVLVTWCALAVLLHVGVIGRGFTSPAVVFTAVGFVIWLFLASTSEWRAKRRNVHAAR